MLGRIIVFMLLATASDAGAASDYPIAGLNPDRRPDGAPVIRENARSPAYEERFFRGVTGTRPASLSWFADQGAWYTPFDRPGMTGPYDLRNWHAGKGKNR